MGLNLFRGIMLRTGSRSAFWLQLGRWMRFLLTYYFVIMEISHGMSRIIWSCLLITQNLEEDGYGGQQGQASHGWQEMSTLRVSPSTSNTVTNGGMDIRDNSTLSWMTLHPSMRFSHII